MAISIDILKDDSRYGKFDQVLDLLFCISSVIFAFAIPFQFLFTPWIAQWFFAVLIFKLYYVLRGKEKIISIDIKNSIAILSLGLFGLLALASTKWSLQPDHTHNMVIAWLSSLFIVPNIYIFSCKRLPITLMFKSYVLGCTSLVLFLLIDLTETALNGDIFYFIEPRNAIMLHIASVSYHHIYLGFIVAISIFIAIRFFFDKETKIFEKIYYIVHTIMSLALLTIDNSRLIFIVLFISILLFSLKKINKNWKVILPIGILFLLIIIAFCILPTRTSETIYSIVSNGNANDPRFEIWKSLLPGIKDVPFLGYGYQATDSVYSKLYEEAHCWFAQQYHYISHSQFIESYYNLGVIGLILSVSILIGFWKFIKLDRTIISSGTFILLVVSMTFDVPFFHCFVIPLLISWLAFCYSGKKDFSPKVSPILFMVILPIVVALSVFIFINSNKAIKKYSEVHEIEMADYSHRQYTKKAIKKFKIKEDNISMVLSDVNSEIILENKDQLIDTRHIALIKNHDTLTCNFDYWISDNYNGSEIVLLVNNYDGALKFDLSKKGQWISESLTIPPSLSYISTNTEGHKSVVYDNKKRAITINAAYSRDNTVKGYAILRNLKIEKKQH